MSATPPRVALFVALVVGGGCEKAIESSDQLKTLDRQVKAAKENVETAAKVAGELIEDAKPLAAAAVDVAVALKELKPVHLERSREKAEARFQDVTGAPTPKGYRGALIADVDLPGGAKVELTSVIPTKANAAVVFAPKTTSLKLSPGKHTIFVGARLPGGDPRLLRLAVSALTDDGDAPFTLGKLRVGKGKTAREVAHYEQLLVKDRALFFFLEDGRVVHAVGPKKGFDEAAVKRLLATLLAAHPKDRFLAELPAP